MKKIAPAAGKALLFAALTWSAGTAAYSLDFGALLSNDSAFVGNKMNELALEQTDTASAWLRLPLGEKAYFATEGFYRFERLPIDLFDVDEVPDEANDESAFDLSLAKVQATVPAGKGICTLSAGRFGMVDATSDIFNQNADGLSAGYASPVINLSVYGAYTGLLNTRTVAMLNEANIAPEDTEKKYELAEKYAVAAATLSLPNFVGSQTATLQALGTFRLEEESFNRLYATLACNGPLHPRLYYTLSSTLALRQYDGDRDLANLTKASLALYTGAKSLAFTANAVYASGKQGPFKAFQGFTSRTAVKANNGRTEYTGLCRGGLGLSLRPAKNLLLAAGGDAVLDAQDSSVTYEGFQWQASANWQIASDVSVCASAYQYRDKDNSYRDKSCVDFYAAIAF